MADSRIPAAIDKLVAIWTAGLTDVSVIDGLLVTGSEPVKRVYVGYDGDPDGDVIAVPGDQSWAGTVGTARRDETFSVTCCIVARNGAGNVKLARDAAFSVFATVSTVLRANVSLDFPPPSKAQIRNPHLRYVLTSTTGVEAHIPFAVEVETRI